MKSSVFQEEAKVLAQTLADCLGDKSVSEYYKTIMECNHKSLRYYIKQDTITKKRFFFFKDKEVKDIEKAEIRKGALRYKRIFRDLDANEWEIIKNVPLLRNGQTYNSKSYHCRVYPQGDLAMRTIGRLDDNRAYGVEFAYRDTLAGRNGRQRVQRITNTLKVRVEDSINVEAQDGYDIVTTLDVDIQDIAHTALSKQLIEEDAIWGTTVVMDCATGDILAMANLKNNDGECVEVQNYALGVPVNPGSTFKLVSTMALLENGVPASRKYNTELGRSVIVGNNTNAKVVDSHAIGSETDGNINMREAFSESSNVYFTKAIYDEFKDNPVEFSDFCKKLQLDTIIGLKEFGAQYKKIVPLDRKHHSRYNALVNMAYGYGLEVTPMHTLALYNAVANNGRMVAPRLILRTERDGKVISESKVKVINEQICSQQTLKTLRSFLEDVSQNGTAKRYFGKNSCPFSSGSKTGTAQVESVINSVAYKRGDGYYYGSMVTYFPAEKPRYTIMTAIFTKRQPGKQYYGAGLTGPVQQHVATYLYNRNHNYAQEVTSAKHRASEIKGGNIENIETMAREHGFAVTLDKHDGWGASTISSNGKSVNISPVNLDKHVVPNIIGMGLSDAIFVLEKCGLSVKVQGHGKIVAQSIEPQTAITGNKKEIIIRLE
jgi:cell division protein FtsI (penicillin-binding protein 3)